MNIAILNDTLDEFGGAERVARVMLRTFPEAQFFTSFADPWILKNFFPQLTGQNLHTSWRVIPHIATHRSLIQLASPLLWRSFDLSRFDVVISNPSNLMCNMIHVPDATHIQYIHAVPKNIYGLLPKTPLQRTLRYDTYIRPLYQKAITNTPHVLTSSLHMQQKISGLFGVSPDILPPPVRIPDRPPIREASDYYLSVSRLDRDKHLELAIMACNRLQVPLLIAGKTNEPRYEAYLHRISGPTVRFLGFQSDENVSRLYRRARAFLFPSREEDFGLAPLEALAHGVPVVAYYGGGPKETLVDGRTGVFFRTHTADSLVAAMQRLSRLKLPPEALRKHAETYGDAIFQKRLRAYVRNARKTAQ